MKSFVISICLISLFLFANSAIAQNSKYFGTFDIDITVGVPICEETAATLEFGSNYDRRGETTYFYLPSDATEETYTFTQSDGDVFTITFTVLDQFSFRVYQEKTTSRYSTVIDLIFVYTNNYQSFTATGTETGGSSCKGPTIYEGTKVGSNDDNNGDNTGDGNDGNGGGGGGCFISTIGL